MKSLYDKDCRYTNEACQFSNEIDKAIRTIFKQMVKDGFSPREISHLAQSVVMDLELDSVLGMEPSKDDVPAYRKE